MKNALYIILLLLLVAVSCGRQGGVSGVDADEDTVAKRLLQGIWIDSDEESPLFQMVGDSVFYPDTAAIPTYFKVVADTFYLLGSTPQTYPIKQQTKHTFVIQGPNGDLLKLRKSTEPFDSVYFVHANPVPLNQRQLIRHDTIVNYDSNRYHLYVQVNPTTYRVVNPSLGDGGIAVDNIYYDNILNITIFESARKSFSSNFYKDTFAKLVPEDYLKKSVLSDIVYEKTDAGGFHFTAYLGIPTSSINYTASILITHKGEIEIK